MPQALVYNPTSSSAVTLPLYDPREERASRRRFGRHEVEKLALANSLYVPTGKWPSRGWVLLRRSDYNQITNLYRTDFQLQITDFVHGQLTFKNLAIVQARCVSRGVAADPNAIYLVELTDLQGCLWSSWFQFPTNSQYNVRSPAYPEQFDSASLNGGVAWTWDGMVGDLWKQMGAFLGAYPGLPIAPLSTPEGYIFPGIPAWEAMNLILDHLGLTTSEDLTKAAPYGIVQIGGADATFSALQAKYANLLEEDMEWIDAGSGRLPGQVIVYFHRRNQYYGTEETVRNDNLQWSTTPLYAVTVPAPAQFANAAGTHSIWTSFTVRFDIDGNPLAADVAAAQAVATMRVQEYYNRAYRGTVGYLRQVYAGALPFYAGSLVDGVRWYQDFVRGDFGWCTELARGPQPPWPEVSIDVGRFSY
jgi:hypothetical protein